MDVHAFANLARTLPTAVIAFLIFAVCAYVPEIKRQIQLAKLPVFTDNMGGKKHRRGYLKSMRDVYSEGCQKFKDSVYQMVTSDGQSSVVIPQKLLPELRKLPDDVLSSAEAVDQLMEMKYTQIEADAKLLAHTVKADLTPALGRLNSIICAEVDDALERYMPPCNDWTEIPINDRSMSSLCRLWRMALIHEAFTNISRVYADFRTRNLVIDIVAQVSGRVFVGPDLSHDPDYLECATKYTHCIVEAIRAIKNIRPWLKPFLAPRLPEVQRLRDMEKRAAKILRPLVRERLEAEKADPNWQKPDDMMQWLLINAEYTSVERLAKVQLGVIFGGIHTTSMSATNILYTLAVTPEYIGPLREELREVMADNDGKLTVRALQQMVKLDSYMREVSRLYPPGITPFIRHLYKGITLSNGQYIPPGVTIEGPADIIYSDPELDPNSTKFDGFRHYKLRQGGASTDHARNQFVTSNESNLTFGYGRHACPGRFFAANEIKMITARLILAFDIEMPGKATERHPQFDVGRISQPHPGKTLMFKRVRL
ncbi:cytochrome P450 monooxygenase-like protein [Paraphoma chrysanthemicola]|uniref:Cytochrome P450 monooxygenase-like protein n=1 Tax=Paraphoma chrysanthemicola TaxID=798071 RepID=A0A8K0RBA3_9PLEO|nr:cytochrome P450 monooxygenase-like protein [Paraphoma chrysanthemicola]